MSEHILLLPFNLKDSIIKVCEQVQHWFQGFDGSEAYAGSMAGDKMGKTSEKRTKARLQERKDKLFTAISQVTKGSCVYCGQPHSTIESFDTVLPSHFKHSGIDRAAVLTYWTAQHQLGNARLCCKACNSHKGGAERRGIAFYRSLLTGCSTFLKPYANAPFFLPFERDAFTWSHWGEPLPGAGPGRNNKPFTPEDYAAIQQAFLRLALWVVCFSSLSEPEADFLLAYAPEHRQLRFFSESELVPTYYQRISYVRWRKWTKKWQQECACNVLQQR